MAYSGYDFFVADVNSGEDRDCQVCGTRCRVTRNVFGPTGFASAMAKRFTHHDEFVCPHTDNEWHERALQLAISIQETPSKRVAELMRADIADLIREHLR